MNILTYRLAKLDSEDIRLLDLVISYEIGRLRKLNDLVAVEKVLKIRARS